MSDNVKELETKLEQCTKDVEKLQEEQAELVKKLEKAKKPKWKQGDVFINSAYTMGSKVRVLIKDGDRWILVSEDDGNQAYGKPTYEQVCEYINDRLPGKRPMGDCYEYQYNLFERKA